MSVLRLTHKFQRGHGGVRPSSVAECARPRAQRHKKAAEHWDLAEASMHPQLAAPGLRRARLRAFTLMEIMIVVGIMGIALTLSVPIVWKVWHKAPMNKAISEMVELCSTARARAILQGVQTQLVLHGNGAITIEGGAGSAPTTVTGVLSPAMPASSSGGAPTSTTLPEGVAIFKFLVGGVDCMQLESARVRFFPNGTCDDFVMQLVSDRAERVEISLEVTTSLASVERDWSKFRIR